MVTSFTANIIPAKDYSMFTSIEAAAAIGTTPRLLRRFLRNNDSWRNAGVGGRYMFTESEVNSLSLQFHKWNKSTAIRPVTKLDPLDHLDQDPGITIEEMLEFPKNPKLRADVLKRRSERFARLEERMRACGVVPVPTYFEEELDA